MAHQQQFQVVIVGGGPVGMALAVELGQRGISTALVERRNTPQRIPKGQSLTQRSLEHFFFWGVVEELRAARVMPREYPIGSITAYGDLMSNYWFGPDSRERVTPFYFQRNERLPQYLTEEVLRRRAADLPNVKCMFGVAAQSIEEDDRGARVITDGGVLEAEYVIGCDGAHSMVREHLGIDRAGADFDQRMVLAVFRSRELHDGLQRFPECSTYRVLRRELQGYWQFFGRVDVGEGWFFHAPVPNDTTVDSFDFLALIQQAAGFPCAAEFDHVGFWDLRIAVASKYRVGRVFIAGDACHSHPPYGGYGLNSGLEDVANLGWKLAAALQGWGGERLLDSYSEERQPVFAQTGEQMIARGIEEDRAFLERYDPRRDRGEFEQAWAELETQWRSRRLSYEPHYAGSSVVTGPAGAGCGIVSKQSFAARAGYHLAPQPLSVGCNVYDKLGNAMTLLGLDARDEDVRALTAAAGSQRVPLELVRDDSQNGRQAYEAKLILVRPDQYVCWAGNAQPDDPHALFKKVCGLG